MGFDPFGIQMILEQQLCDNSGVQIPTSSMRELKQFIKKVVWRIMMGNMKLNITWRILKAEECYVGH